jgi:hypothetical protein
MSGLQGLHVDAGCVSCPVSLTVEHPITQL